MHSECVKVFLYVFVACSTVLKDKRNHYYCHRRITGVTQARKHFLTFEGTATDSESTLHSTFVYASFAATRGVHSIAKDANDEIFVTLQDVGDDKDYKKAFEKLTAHFSPQVNITYEVWNFRQAELKDGETLDSFHTRLRASSYEPGFRDLALSLNPL